MNLPGFERPYGTFTNSIAVDETIEWVDEYHGVYVGRVGLDDGRRGRSLRALA